MPEGTIFQDQNIPLNIPNNNRVPTSQPLPPVSPAVSQDLPPPLEPGGGRFSPKKLLKLALIGFIILTIIFLVIAVILPRIGGSSDKSVTISYWAVKDDPALVETIISDFEKENPNINVEYIKQDPLDYREKLTTRIRNGNVNAPDVYKFHNTWYPMLRDSLLPVPQETMGKIEFLDRFYPAAQKDLIKSGAIYGIPAESDTLALFVNSKLLDEASNEQNTVISIPATWQEFIDVSSKLTKRDDTGQITVAGAGIGTFENVNHAPDIISLLLVQNGVDFSNLEESQAQAADALRFYTNFALIEESVWDNSMQSSLQAFMQGNLAMFFGYSDDYSKIKASNPGLDFKVVPVPQLLISNKINIASYWANGVSANTKFQKESLLFLRFLARSDTQRKFYEAQSKIEGIGQPYSDKSLAADLLKTDAFVFADQSKTALSSPFVDDTMDNGINDKLNEALKNAINSILAGDSTENAAGLLIQEFYAITDEFVPQAVR